VAEVTVTFYMDLVTQKVEDRWVARALPLGITAYGQTETEAEKRVRELLAMSLTTLGTSEKVAAYFTQHHVQYFVSHDAAAPKTKRNGEKPSVLPSKQVSVYTSRKELTTLSMAAG
jgi:hypothetical protein